MADDAIDKRRAGRGIGENVCPFAEGEVSGQDEAAALVALADDLEEQIGGPGIVGEVPHPVENLKKMANRNPSPSTRFKPGYRGGPGGRPMGLALYIQDKTHKGRKLIDWYLAIWRGEKEPLGRIPKPAERFEAAETFLAYGWGRPPQYVDLALASTEVKRIEVTFEAMARDGDVSTSPMVVDVAPAPHGGQGGGPSASAAPLGLPALHSHDDC